MTAESAVPWLRLHLCCAGLSHCIATCRLTAELHVDVPCWVAMLKACMADVKFLRSKLKL